MLISELVLLGTVWYMLKAVPGLMQTLAYLFGFLLASWSFDEYFRRE